MALTPNEIAEALRVVYTTLKLLTDEEALAGIVLTESSFDGVRDLFGFEAQPHKVGTFIADPNMSSVFVVNRLLVMRGTQIQ